MINYTISESYKKLLEECEKTNEIFQGKKFEETVTYEDLFKITQGLSNIIACIFEQQIEIFENMLKLHGLSNLELLEKRLDK